MRRFVEACHRTRTILPATTTIERLCADALVDAERQIEARIAERVPPGLRRDLEHLLEETLRTLDIEASPVAKPLLEAVDVLRSDATARPTGFLRPNARSPER